jgi:hypothetical protein
MRPIHIEPKIDHPKLRKLHYKIKAKHQYFSGKNQINPTLTTSLLLEPIFRNCGLGKY